MRLIIVGCEYSGKTTLAKEIEKWWKEMTSVTVGVHDHFAFPTPEVSEDDQKRLLALGPRVREMFQRYMITYHLQPAFFEDDDIILVGFHIEEAVMAPLYYGYGREGEYAARSDEARHVEKELLEKDPHIVLVFMKASSEVIAKRMKANPHPRSPLKEEDVPKVLEAYEKEVKKSMIRYTFTIDTSNLTVDEMFKEWIRQMEPHFRIHDHTRMLVHRNLIKQ